MYPDVMEVCMKVMKIFVAYERSEEPMFDGQFERVTGVSIVASADEADVIVINSRVQLANLYEEKPGKFYLLIFPDPREIEGTPPEVRYLIPIGSILAQISAAIADFREMASAQPPSTQ